jgi:hypothetical protein
VLVFNFENETCKILVTDGRCYQCANLYCFSYPRVIFFLVATFAIVEDSDFFAKVSLCVQR